MLQKIFSDIQIRLQEKVPALKFIDEDRGVTAYENSTIDWPCALINVEGFDFSQTSGTCQIGEGRVSVIIAAQETSSINLLTTENPSGREFFDILDAVHKALHTYTDGSYTPLMRISLKRLARVSTVREYQFIFKVAYTEEEVKERKYAQISDALIDIEKMKN